MRDTNRTGPFNRTVATTFENRLTWPTSRPAHLRQDSPVSRSPTDFTPTSVKVPGGRAGRPQGRKPKSVLHDHPGVQVVCRAPAVRGGLRNPKLGGNRDSRAQATPRFVLEACARVIDWYAGRVPTAALDLSAVCRAHQSRIVVTGRAAQCGSDALGRCRKLIAGSVAQSGARTFRVRRGTTRRTRTRRSAAAGPAECVSLLIRFGQRSRGRRSIHEKTNTYA